MEAVQAKVEDSARKSLKSFRLDDLLELACE